LATTLQGRGQDRKFTNVILWVVEGDRRGPEDELHLHHGIVWQLNFKNLLWLNTDVPKRACDVL
jgi:hypothetical protein